MPTFWKTNVVWNKKPKVKKPPTPEDACWRAFSKYVRTRDCLATVGVPQAGRCVTCGKIVPNKGNDAGHFISRTAGSVKYDPMNCHLQCGTCNRFQQGKWFEYRQWMLGFYGTEQVDRIESEASEIERKWIDWKAEAALWRSRTKELLAVFEEFKNGATIRKLISADMQQGTLEGYLDGRIELGKKKKVK